RALRSEHGRGAVLDVEVVALDVDAGADGFGIVLAVGTLVVGRLVLVAGLGLGAVAVVLVLFGARDLVDLRQFVDGRRRQRLPTRLVRVGVLRARLQRRC